MYTVVGRIMTPKGTHILVTEMYKHVELRYQGDGGEDSRSFMYPQALFTVEEKGKRRRKK